LAVTVSYNNPKLAKGTLVSINGVCAIPNGGSAEVDEETLALFKKANGQDLATAYKKSKLVTITSHVTKTQKKEEEVKDA
jgi:hypothetical protein